MKKYYSLLNLEEGSSKKEIEKAYKKICKELKQIQEDKDVEHIFKESLVEVQEAYEKIMEEIQKSELAVTSKNNEEEISLAANDENEEIISDSILKQDERYEKNEKEIINPVKKGISWKELILGVLLLLIASGIWANIFISSNNSYATQDVRVINTVDTEVQGSVKVNGSVSVDNTVDINIAKINGKWNVFYDSGGNEEYIRLPVYTFN